MWEVVFDKSGSFKEVKRAFELKGHDAGVHSFSFNSDSSRYVTSIAKTYYENWTPNYSLSNFIINLRLLI